MTSAYRRSYMSQYTAQRSAIIDSRCYPIDGLMIDIVRSVRSTFAFLIPPGINSHIEYQDTINLSYIALLLVLVGAFDPSKLT